eukprot:364391-Chlamydomonas_euryale.AAC.4
MRGGSESLALARARSPFLSLCLAYPFEKSASCLAGRTPHAVTGDEFHGESTKSACAWASGQPPMQLHGVGGWDGAASTTGRLHQDGNVVRVRLWHGLCKRHKRSPGVQRTSLHRLRLYVSTSLGHLA